MADEWEGQPTDLKADMNARFSKAKTTIRSRFQDQGWIIGMLASRVFLALAEIAEGASELDQFKKSYCPVLRGENNAGIRARG
jgi:hypothetical protein